MLRVFCDACKKEIEPDGAGVLRTTRVVLERAVKDQTGVVISRENELSKEFCGACMEKLSEELPFLRKLG